MATALERAAKHTGLEVRDLLRVGAGFVVDRIDRDGGLVLPAPEAPPTVVRKDASTKPLWGASNLSEAQRFAIAGILCVTPCIVERLAKACAVARIKIGANDLADLILIGVLRSFEDGDFRVILDGYDFGNARSKKAVTKALQALAEQWRRHDRFMDVLNARHRQEGGAAS